ncbi:hypothetical protein HaLaN_03892 [Haematococcus lacustris]|uniref:Uncharacterized protein n=1 Tax=Haematococcus lacustris TaxID=44745 RepID=A0A699YLW6_HAELA|nr:hypothetical protein HaLaN_03892 [Haematococcus lacustris]
MASLRGSSGLWTPEQQQGSGAADSQLGVQAVMPASSNDSSGAQGAGAGGLSRTTSTGATAAAGCLGRCGAGEESGVGGSSQQPSARLLQGALRWHTPVGGGVDGSSGSTRHGSSPGPGQQQRPAEYAGAGVGRDEEAILMLLREGGATQFASISMAATPTTCSRALMACCSVKQLGQVEGQAGGGGAGTMRRHASLMTGSRSSRGSGASDNFTVLRATVADWLAEDMFEENDVMAAIMQQEHT